MVVQNEENLIGESLFHKPVLGIEIWETDGQKDYYSDKNSVQMNNSDPCKTPKSQKISSSTEIKRWASVVKSRKTPQQSVTSSTTSSDQMPSETVDSVFQSLPKNFYAQKGFIVGRNRLFFCIPCTLEFDSALNVSNHLKTRKHEDNVISYFRKKLPSQLDIIMVYVSFHGFSLCCNLCRCTIAMSSYNPYETIVNIIAHNYSESHMSQKATCDTSKDYFTDIEPLAINSVPEDNLTVVKKRSVPSTQLSSEFQIKSSNKPVSKKNFLEKILPLSNIVGEHHMTTNTMKENASGVIQTAVQEKNSRLNGLLSAIPSGLMHIDCIVENNRGSITCLICDRVVPPSTHNLYTHLLGSNHKKNAEKANLTNIKQNEKKHKVDCSEPDKHCNYAEIDADDITSILKQIPLYLKAVKSHSVKVITKDDLENLFQTLITENPLISKNECVFVRNVDGRNSYCKLCRTLIPLSDVLSTLENNLIQHFVGEKHVAKFSDFNSSKQKKSINLGSGRVSRSLFAFTDKCSKVDEESKSNDLENIAMFYNLPNFKENEPAIELVSNPKTQGDTSPIKLEKDSKAIAATKINATPKSLPLKKIRYLKVETEQDEEVLNRRQKQINYGKNTEGYALYCQKIARARRSVGEPVTPPRHVKCSRRTWDGMVRVWRRQLHAWDPPTTVDTSWLKVLP